MKSLRRTALVATLLERRDRDDRIARQCGDEPYTPTDVYGSGYRVFSSKPITNAGRE